MSNRRSVYTLDNFLYTMRLCNIKLKNTKRMLYIFYLRISSNIFKQSVLSFYLRLLLQTYYEYKKISI